MEGWTIFLIIVVIVGLVLATAVIILIWQLLCYSIWIRLAVGAGLIWLIWANTVPEAEPLSYIATAIIALGILSPWLVVIAVGSFITAYLLMRNR